MNNPAQVYVNTNFSPSSPSPKGVSRKVLLIIGVVIILVLEGVWAYNKLTSANSNSQNSLSEESGSTEHFSTMIIGGPPSVQVNENFEALVNISSGFGVDGVDAVIKYDPNLLSVVSPTASRSGAMTPGNLFSDYPVNTNDPVEGVVTLSAATPPNAKPFLGSGIFGRILFKAKAAGETEIKIDYAPGGTTDSNVVDADTGDDILNETTNLKITIKP